MLYTPRRVHLDFHTSPLIGQIGAKFDKKDFQQKLIDAKVQSITLFAKCHHGFTYYPSNVCDIHEHLNFDLLSAQIEAAHEIGVKAPIYITLGWSAIDAEKHKKWLAYDFNTKKVRNNRFDVKANKDQVAPESSWISLCPVGEYSNLLKKITAEVCDRFAPVDGIFYDICFDGDTCVCPSCKKGMKKMGFNPKKLDDVKKYFEIKRVELMDDLTRLIKSKSKDATIFFNGSCAGFNDEYLKFQTHYEVEELPTVLGTYDKIHVAAKRLEGLGKEIIGMTGKFHYAWGEFGGFKNPEALRIECATCLSLGAGVSVGDQMHPQGLLDKGTYEIIGQAFSYMEKIEKYCLDTKSACDIGALISNDGEVDSGVCLALSENQIDYDVLTIDSNFSKYSCIIVPDVIKVTEELNIKLKDFVNNGGKLILSGSSVKNTDFGIEYLGKSTTDVSYVRPLYKSQLASPNLLNAGAHVVRSDLKVKAELEEPYFNRTYGHFCGHKNTPNCAETASYPAMLEGKNFIYFAHEIFREYANFGAYWTRKYIEYALDKFCSNRKLKVTGLMSIGRARIRENEKKKFYSLNLFYAPPIKRGNVTVLEDLPTVKDIIVSYQTDKEIKEVIMMPQRKKVDFSVKNGKLTFTAEVSNGHQLYVIKY